MGWLASLFTALCAAVVGAFSAGFVADLACSWYRISSREGGAGYFVLLWGLLGAIVGFVGGLILARVSAAYGMGFPKGFGFSVGSILAVVLVVGLLGRLFADIRPKMEGRSLSVEVEIRCPAGAPKPEKVAVNGGDPHIWLQSGGGSASSFANIRFEGARLEGDRWVLPVEVDLGSSRSNRMFTIVLPPYESEYFFIPLAGRPGKRDLEWTDWFPRAGEPKVGPTGKERKLEVRYRVIIDQPIPAPPEPVNEPEPVKEPPTAQAPLVEWLPFLQRSEPDEERAKAYAVVTARSDFAQQLAALILDEDREISDLALRAVEGLQTPAPSLGEPVHTIGAQILADILKFNDSKPEDDPSYEFAGQVDWRFAGWHEAMRILHERGNVDFLVQLKEILAASSKRDDSIAINDITRVAKYYVEKWSAAGAPK